MTLLAPAAAAWAAALTLPVLVAFYLLKLRRRPVRVSSIVLWARAAEDLQVNVPLRWLRPSLLFLLHLLILGLMVLALGRPAIDADAPGANRVIVILDRSASMSAADGDPAGADDRPQADRRTRLDEAKARGAELVRAIGRASAGSMITVVSMAAEAGVLVGPTNDAGRAAEVISSVTPTDQPADLLAALRLVSAIAAPEGDESAAAPPRVILLSDGGLELSDDLTVGQAEFEFIRVGRGAAPAPDAPLADARPDGNLGIVVLSAARDDQNPAFVRVFARLVSTRAEPTPTTVTLTLDGQPRERRAVVVPAAVDDGIRRRLGQWPVTFEVLSPAGGLAAVTLPGGDLLPADDQAAIILTPADRPEVWLVGPASGAAAAAGLTPEGLLADVLAELPLSSLRKLTREEFDALPGLPMSLDLVVFDRVTPKAEPPVPTISFGAGMPAGPMSLSGPSGGTYVLSWRRAHPILRDVAMDTVYAARTFEFAPAAGDSGVMELARGQRGPLIRLSPGDTPRLVVAFELAQSNWQLQAGFSIFLASAVEHLARRASEPAAQLATTASAIQLRADDPARPITLEGPEAVAAPTTPTGVVRVGPLARAGVYTVRGGTVGASPSSGGSALLAVNLLDERESAIETRDELRIGGRVVSARASGPTTTEVWPWLVLAAGVLLLVEWFVFGLRARV